MTSLIRRHNILYNDTQHNDTEHNDPYYNNIQRNDTRKNDGVKVALFSKNVLG